MGCDIHLFVEVKKEGEWECISDDWYDGRSYSLFGILADVRNYSKFPPISKPRGLPEDFSLKSYREHYGWDGHSDSYYSLKELLDFNWDRQVYDYRDIPKETTYRKAVGNFVEKLHCLEAELGCNPENVRLVFWFDN